MVFFVKISLICVYNSKNRALKESDYLTKANNYKYEFEVYYVVGNAFIGYHKIFTNKIVNNKEKEKTL